MSAQPSPSPSTSEPHAAAERPARWTPVVLMMLASFVSYLDRNTLAVLAPTILASTGMTAEQYGFAVSCFSVGYMLGNPVWGWVFDTRGLRAGMTVAVAIWSLASFAHAEIGLAGWMTAATQFAIARFVLGTSEGATFPAAARTASVSLPASQQGRGLAVGYSGGSLGAIFTPLIVTPIALAHGWQAAFFVSAGVGLLWIVLWRIFTARNPSLDEVALKKFDRALLAQPALWAFLCLYAFGAIPLAIGIYAAPIYLADVMGMSQASLGRWLWVPPLGWEVGYFFWGWILDRKVANPARLVPLLAIGSGVTAVLPFATEAAAAIALFFFAMFFSAGFIICALRYGMWRLPGNQAFLAGAGAGSWSALVAVVMPWVGAHFDARSYDAVFYGVACLPPLGAVIWAFLNGRARRLASA
jgi:ACS family hexuronate transporter-like MFS transporter